MSGDRGRELVDTNVLAYAHDVTAGPKREKAQALLARLWQDQNGCVSIQVLQELYVTLTRKVRVPLPGEKALEVVSALSYWKVHSPEPEDVQAAIQSHLRNRVSFWDAMIIQSARRLDCAVIWSEDLSAGQIYEGVRLSNPFT
jgi:predicted nucleic acid-binding protein